MNQCQQCRKEKWPWQECPGVPCWFSPMIIWYCYHQVDWILTNFTLLVSGLWPPEGLDTGYYDTGGRKLRRGGAYYEVPVAVASDVELRLNRCGPDGELVRVCKVDGIDVERQAYIQSKPVYILEAKIKRVINYCSGFRARQLTFEEFTRRRGISDNYCGRANKICGRIQ